MAFESIRRGLVLVAACVFALPVRGTWSIVIVDRRTGEVGVAVATCIPGSDLTKTIPALVVGRGAGVVQASGDPGNRALIYQGLLDGDDPADILALMKVTFPVQVLQTGIVDVLHPPVTFSGGAVSPAKKGVVGEVGDLAYAIQGNVLAGEAVILEAEKALLITPGDLGQRLLAGMQAARSFGGDGRCSCPAMAPTACGSPPASFTKSAHSVAMIVARPGDVDGPCLTNGCASGSYHLRLISKGPTGGPDPHVKLQSNYNLWRTNRAGRPDGLLSTVDAVDSLPADGATERTVTIALVDLDGSPLVTGGALIEVTTESGAPSLATVGPVVDHGDGTYSFTLKAGTTPGTDRFVITAEDDFLKATLAPYLEVRSEAATALHAGLDEISASSGGTIPLVVNEPARPNGRYAILGSLSGTTPGFALGDALLPLRLDDFLPFTVAHANDPAIFPGTTGLLDDRGRAEAAVIVPPGGILSLVGRTTYWASAVIGPGGPLTSDPVSVPVLP